MPLNRPVESSVDRQNEMNISDMQKEIGKLKSLIIALEKKPDSLNEEIFQKYLEFESTPKVAKYLRDKGIRTQRNRSFQSGDISEMVTRVLIPPLCKPCKRFSRKIVEP